MPTLVFDIETVPDAAGLRSAWGLAGDDDTVVEAALARRREQTGGASDFLPLHLHRVIVISMLFRDSDGLRVRSLHGGPDDEAKVVQAFFRTLAKHTPTLVSWNGSGFDMQVLHYRGLMHKVQAPRYWEQGEDDRDFKYNNYLNRYHSRHTDLMDLLALHNGRANAPLDQLAKLCGFPGKLGMDGSQVYAQFQAGHTEDIRRYCETDVMNTYLLYCRFQKMRGGFTEAEYAQEIAFVQEQLGNLAPQEPHWQEYLQAWT